MAKKLKWVTTEYGLMPACVDCSQLMLDPMFVEAVYSTAIDKPLSGEKLTQTTVAVYHEQGHKL